MQEVLVGLVSACAGIIIGAIIGYYKSLNDMSKLYCLKTDCVAIRVDCGKHKDDQDRRLNEGQVILSKIQIDIQEIKTTLKFFAEKQ